MRSSLAVCAVASYLAGTSALQLLEKRDGVAPRVVQHTIRRNHVADPIASDRARHRRRRRDGTVQASLANAETLYFMDLSVGTPAQDLKMHIDTGSSDLWVNVPNSKLCEESSNPCASSGTFTPGNSHTYTYINSDFNITYVDGSGAQGDYASDTVQFSGVTLKDQILGVGLESTTPQGILGIGYPSNEVAVSYNFKPYANVPVSLVDKGYINTNAYSLWLDDLDSSSGSILFGGVDTAKYTGELQTLPILKTEGYAYIDFIIALTAVGVNGNTGSITNDLKVPALLDSGSSLMYLPNDVTNKIYNALGATYDRNIGAGSIDCNMANSDQTIDFTFSSPTIRVPLNEMILQAGPNECILGIGYAQGNTPVLGDSFIRSAYIVYDISNNEISLAQANYNSKSSNILEISGDTIPSATTVTDPVTSVAQASAGPVNYNSYSSSSSSHNLAAPTAAVGYNMALLGAVGAALFAL